MKRILVNDRTAQEINALKMDESGQWSLAKVGVADALSELTNLLLSAKDDEGGELTGHVDGVIQVMETISEYNDLLNDIAFKHDGGYPYYELHFPKEGRTDTILSKKDYEILEKIFEENPSCLKNAEVDIDALTFSEAAEMLGMSEGELRSTIFNRKMNGKL